MPTSTPLAPAHPEIRGVGVGGGTRHKPQGLAFFLLTSGRRRKKTKNQATQKNKEGVLYRPGSLAGTPGPCTHRLAHGEGHSKKKLTDLRRMFD
jgi:hypothetical protein